MYVRLDLMSNNARVCSLLWFVLFVQLLVLDLYKCSCLYNRYECKVRQWNVHRVTSNHKVTRWMEAELTFRLTKASNTRTQQISHIQVHRLYYSWTFHTTCTCSEQSKEWEPFYSWSVRGRQQKLPARRSPKGWNVTTARGLTRPNSCMQPSTTLLHLFFVLVHFLH